MWNNSNVLWKHMQCASAAKTAHDPQWSQRLSLTEISLRPAPIRRGSGTWPASPKLTYPGRARWLPRPGRRRAGPSPPGLPARAGPATRSPSVTHSGHARCDLRNLRRPAPTSRSRPCHRPRPHQSPIGALMKGRWLNSLSPAPGSQAAGSAEQTWAGRSQGGPGKSREVEKSLGTRGRGGWRRVRKGGRERKRVSLSGIR